MNELNKIVNITQNGKTLVFSPMLRDALEFITIKRKISSTYIIPYITNFTQLFELLKNVDYILVSDTEPVFLNLDFFYAYKNLYDNFNYNFTFTKEFNFLGEFYPKHNFAVKVYTNLIPS
ncbi:MAG: hypothetical protein QXT38_01380 [Candidatus Aenigmatarchaeota archaeon]